MQPSGSLSSEVTKPHRELHSLECSQGREVLGMPRTIHPIGHPQAVWHSVQFHL